MRRSGCPSQERSRRKSGRRGGHATGLKVLVGPPVPSVDAQMSVAVAPSFFSPLKTSNGSSAPVFDRAVIANSCGGRCCEAFVRPVVTVSQAALLCMPGGRSVLARCSAAAGDTAATKPTTRERPARVTISSGYVRGAVRSPVGGHFRTQCHSRRVAASDCWRRLGRRRLTRFRMSSREV
jgi:hypothetical protein